MAEERAYGEFASRRPRGTHPDTYEGLRRRTLGAL